MILFNLANYQNLISDLRNSVKGIEYYKKENVFVQICIMKI